MRILIDGRLLSNKPTGISRYTRELINSYEERYGKENVWVICDFSIKSDSFKIIHTKFKPYNLFDFIRFYFFVRSLQFDIYHSAFYSGLLFKIKNTIQIVTVHDLMFYKVPEFFSDNHIVNSLGKIYYQILVKISLKNADIIISVSETTSKDLENVFGFKSLIIGEGLSPLIEKDVNVNENINQDFNTLNLYGLDKRKYFLYVGNNRRHKNMPFLINAFKSSNTNYKLVLVGFTDKELENEINIVNINFVSDVELVILYKNCIAFIFPSLYEGFGLPVLEAINNKCIVFSSNAGSLREFKFQSIRFFDPKSEKQLIELINYADGYTYSESDKELLLIYDWQKKFNIFQNFLKAFLEK